MLDTEIVLHKWLLYLDSVQKFLARYELTLLARDSREQEAPLSRPQAKRMAVDRSDKL